MSSTQSTVSVCMSVYGISEFLDEQLKSIIEQTIPPDEIVIFEDKHPEFSPELHIKEYLDKTDIILKYIKSEFNVGPAEGFRKSIIESTCDVILLCDHDDIWYKDKVKRVVDTIGDSSVLIHNAHCLGGDESFKDGEIIYSRNPNANYLYQNLLRNRVVGATMAGNGFLWRIYATRYNFYPMHDWVIISLTNFTKGKVVYIDDSLMFYRRHSNTVTGRYKGNLRIKLANVIKYRLSLAKTLYKAKTTRDSNNV